MQNPGGRSFLVPIDAAGEIRVLVLHPGSPTDKLEGHFEIVTFDPDTRRPLAGSADWEAVSYVWEGQIPSEPLEIDGCRRLVTQNVVSILKDLRQQDRPRNLWIDGICIDQDDAFEKPQQVAIMLQVYQCSSSVIIWFRESRSGTEIQASLAVAEWMMDLQRSGRAAAVSTSMTLRECFDGYCRTKGLKFKELRPVTILLANPWFQRVWVIQEAAVAKKLFVSMSRTLVPWSTLAEIAFRYPSEHLPAREAMKLSLSECYRRCVHNIGDSSAGKGIRMVYLVQRLRNLQEVSSTVLPPSEVVYLTAGRVATVPQDNVYAMTGLFQLWATHFPIDIDYSVPASEVFQRFTIHCIEHEQTLDVLSQIRMRERARDWMTSDEIGRELPSWSVNWTSAHLNWYQQATPPADALEDASGNFFSSDYPVMCARDGKMLTLRGFIVDEIVGGSGFCESRGMTEERLQELNRLPRLWRDGQRKHEETDLGDHFEAFKMKGGGVAVTFGYERFENAVVCYLVGARHPILLGPVRSPGVVGQVYRVIFGICIVEGFEDGKGVEKAMEMGLRMQDVHLVCPT